MKHYFTKGELALWLGSVFCTGGAFFLFDRTNYLSLVASLVGVTSLIFSAKGHPVGQLLMVVFSLLYGIISWSFAYYGEMITYLGMTMPMAVFAFIAWVRNPFEKKKSEVKVNTVGRGELLLMSLGAALVTTAFYFILQHFHTANLLPSTLSVTTSFVAVYLTFRRSPLYALAYAANDLILILLWVLASLENSRYISVVICFAAFLAGDLYGFLAWQRMKRRQKKLA